MRATRWMAFSLPTTVVGVFGRTRFHWNMFVHRATIRGCMSFRELVPIIQTAIGPVILISGIGLLLLSMTNRYGRVIDRTRWLAEHARKATPQQSDRLTAQLSILFRRARLIRLSITLASLSLLLTAVLIIGLFLGALFRVEIGLFIIILFVACMSILIASLAVFIRDLNLSLAALKLEVETDIAPDET